MTSAYRTPKRTQLAILPWLGLLSVTAAILGESPLLEPIVQRLQGSWEGVAQGEQSNTRYTIKVDGTLFYFQRDSNFWFETSITVPKASGPQQLHATIKRSAKGQESSVGKTVVAIMKIEKDTLTIVTGGGGDDEAPQSFDIPADKGIMKYELRRVRPKDQVIAPK